METQIIRHRYLYPVKSVLHGAKTMDPLENSASDDDAASQTTEDDPQIPESQEPASVAEAAASTSVLVSNTQPPPVPPPPVPPPTASGRERPQYELRHTMRGHTKSLSAIKFSPDGTILASCGSLFICFWKTLNSNELM